MLSKFRQASRALVQFKDPVRLHAMDGLRGIAMIAVFYCHFCALWAGFAPKGLAGLFSAVAVADGGWGTNLFMLLSGMFSYRARMLGKVSFQKFISGRIWRIYPLYFLLCSVYIAISVLIPKLSRLPAKPWDATIFSLETLLFLPDLLRITPLLEFSWTLSYIMAFYFVYGAVAALFRHYTVSRRWRFVMLVAAAVLWATTGEMTGWWRERTVMFWVGMALSEIIAAVRDHGVKWQRVALIFAFPASFGCLGLWTAAALSHARTGYLSSPVFRGLLSPIALMSFVLIVFFGPAWCKQWLSSKSLRLLGAISYPYYLTHGFTVKAFGWVLFRVLGPSIGSPGWFWASQIVGLITSVIFALVVNIYVDKPLSMRVRAWMSKESEGPRWAPNMSPALASESVISSGR